jgi:hypothetical protein
MAWHFRSGSIIACFKLFRQGYDQNLSERKRITIQIEQKQMHQIEMRIKAEYPRIRNVSELVRAALADFLAESEEMSR